MDLDRYRDALLRKKQELLGGTAAKPLQWTMENNSGRQGDMADQASGNNEVHIQLKLKQTDAKILQAIEDALNRIESGTYGVCRDCGEPIAEARLNARYDKFRRMGVRANADLPDQAQLAYVNLLNHLPRNGNRRRRHAELHQPHPDEQRQHSWIRCHLAAHREWHLLFRRRAADVPNEAKNRRVQWLVEMRDALVRPIHRKAALNEIVGADGQKIGLGREQIGSKCRGGYFDHHAHLERARR